MANQDQGRIDRLRRQLYSREYTAPESTKRSEFSQTEKETERVATEWGNGPEEPEKEFFLFREGVFVKWALIIAVIFFLISFIIAAFIFLGGGSRVSSENVDIRVLGPVSVGGGDELSLEIIVDNKNNVDLESVNVLVTYPEGARQAGNIERELVREQKNYGPIGAGSNARQTFESVLFGEQESVKELVIVAQYRVVGSSATFEKEKKHEIKISSAPVLVDVDFPTEIGTDKEVEFVVDVSSNVNTPIENVLLVAHYPFGFTPKESSPSVMSGTNNTWSLGRLDPEEKVTIRFSGTLEAQNNEERTFRFDVGTAKAVDEQELGATFLTSAHTVAVNTSGLILTGSVNGQTTNETTARAGQSVQTTLSWVNNLAEPITNASITARFFGDLINRNTVTAGAGGFYRSSDDTVSWSHTSNPSLKNITPSGSGSVNFGFQTDTLTSALANSVRNPEITIELEMQGTRLSQGNVPETVTSVQEKKVKISTNLDFSGRAVRTVGPIENIGPIPPQVDQTTTYTVIWSLTNSFNDARNVQVVAQLPAYVEWEGIVSPTNQNVTFDQITNQVTWNVPRVPAGAGFSGSPQEVAFRVAMTPSLSQVGATPVLIERAEMRARDAFTGVTLSDSLSALTTDLGTDPGVSFNDSRVVN